MTPYQTVVADISPCRTLGDLQRVWAKHQRLIATMEKTHISWLIAMKDYYKGMIKRGEIDTYLSKRNAAAAQNKVQKSPDQDNGRVV